MVQYFAPPIARSRGSEATRCSSFPFAAPLSLEAQEDPISIRPKIRSIIRAEKHTLSFTKHTLYSPAVQQHFTLQLHQPAHSTRTMPSMLSCSRVPVTHHHCTLRRMHTPSCRVTSSTSRTPPPPAAAVCPAPSCCHTSSAAVASWNSHGSISSSISFYGSLSPSSSSTGQIRGGLSGLGFETPRGNPWVASSGARRGVVAHVRRKRKNPQPDKLMDGVEQIVDDYDIEKVASAPQLSADDVAAGELSLDCNRFLIGRSMINDRVSDHEEGITWLRSAPRLLWVARERRAEADAVERQRRRGEK
ncbi:unnamed protein product [Closterium sp. Yama58-4]|nr:unnamed protein product [Closterium sp. Yama58-4]